MEVDESFAEYVAARWSMLYRLAVLLVDEDHADDLTRVALVRAYLVWPDVQAAPSADDLVKELLASTAVRPGIGPAAGYGDRADEATEPVGPAGGPAGGTAGGTAVGPAAGTAVGDRERLWASVSGLPPRQRALLVLRHYEARSDAEIGRTVKLRAGAVTAEAGALETGIDLTDLREELFERAEAVVVPFPPTDDLLRQGHQARRRRARRVASLSAAVAGVLVLVVVLAAVLEAHPSRRPTRSPTTGAAAPPFLAALPAGPRPTIAYSVRHFLYLPGGRGIDLGGTPSAIVQTPDWVYVALVSGRIVRVDTHRIVVEPVVAFSGGQLVGDPDGGQVAWLTSSSGRAVVRLVSTAPAQPADTGRLQTFPAALRCCDDPFQLEGITADGELIATLPAEGRAWSWDTRAQVGGVEQISGMGTSVVSQVTAHGVVVRYPAYQYAVGEVGHGIFLEISEFTARDADFSDPLGRRMVYADDTRGIVVRERVPRGRSRRDPESVVLRLPPLETGFAAVRWEDQDHVILDVLDASEPNGALVRCDARSGSCELADALEGPHLLPR